MRRCTMPSRYSALLCYAAATLCFALHCRCCAKRCIAMPSRYFTSHCLCSTFSTSPCRCFASQDVARPLRYGTSRDGASAPPHTTFPCRYVATLCGTKPNAALAQPLCSPPCLCHTLQGAAFAKHCHRLTLPCPASALPHLAAHSHCGAERYPTLPMPYCPLPSHYQAMP